MASRSLTSLITLSIALCALPALAQPQAAPPAQDALQEHFIAEHEIGRRFSIDPPILEPPPEPLGSRLARPQRGQRRGLRSWRLTSRVGLHIPQVLDHLKARHDILGLCHSR